MAKKTVNFNKTGLGKLPDKKPVLYKILTPKNNVNYAGVAKKGRVQERLEEHLPGGKDHIPGSKVQIEQFGSLADAKKKEAGVIKRTQPKYNKQEK